MIYCFGDSWGVGSELKKGEKPFVELFNEPYKNYSFAGNSYPIIMVAFLDNYKDIKPEDTVIIVVPPDIRWYTQLGDAFKNFNIGVPFHKNFPNKKYMEWIDDKDSRWFIFHSSLFTYTIQTILDKIGCRYLFMHNYGGEFIIDDRFKSLINIDNFLNIKKSLTDLLSDSTDDYSAWKREPIKKWWKKLADGPTRKAFSGIYFEGNLHHPNQLGHYRIKELVEDALIKRT